MKIGITGGYGFIGWHLRCYLKTLEDVCEVRIAGRKIFSEQISIERFVKGLHCIIHLAGVNRAKETKLLYGNIEPAEKLVMALEATNSTPCVIHSSSILAEAPQTTYGQAKLKVADILNIWAEANSARVVNIIIPHVFGEYGRPFYNSAMATFCHLIASNNELTINKDGKLEIIHVQDLVEEFIDAYHKNKTGKIRIKGFPINVEDAANRLKSLYTDYVEYNQLPDLTDHIDRCMFNALRGAFESDRRVIPTQKHKDDRGWLVETVRAGSGGQCFVSITKPGITRGNHFHRRKIERFFVLQGEGEIKLRKLFTDEIISYKVDGTTPSYVDIPTLHTHSITNVGNDELITLFWADEFFDPDNPDTYFEYVETSKS